MFVTIGAVTVYDSCVGSAVHRVDGQGHITCLDLLSSSTHLTLAVACSVVQPRPNGMAPLTMSVMTVLTCQEGRGWHTMVIRPHQESACNSSPVSKPFSPFFHFGSYLSRLINCQC